MTNVSNVSFASNISGTIAKENAEAFEDWLVSISWLSVLVGTYLKHCCIRYVGSKPPGHQSMLDGIQVQMLWIWTLEDGMTAILNAFLISGHQSYPAAWIIGYGTFITFTVSQFHLMICVSCRIGLIFFQDKVESFLEDNILIGTLILEVVISLLISTLLASFGQNPNYVVQLLPPKSNPTRGPLAFVTLMALQIISCVSEIAFRAYLHFFYPNATSSILITTYSILVLTFSHLIGLFIGAAIYVFKLPFDMGIVSLGGYLILKSLFLPICILLGNDGVAKIVKDELFDVFIIVLELKTKLQNVFSKITHLCRSNQVVPQEMIELNEG